METHKKKRLEVMIEAPLVNRLTDLLDRNGAKGYTVLPAIAGRGQGGKWSREGQIIQAQQQQVVICIVDEAQSEAIITGIQEMLARYIGILNISDVEVLRDDHF